MSVQNALHTPALVHARLLRNFIEATEFECAQATEDHVRESLEEMLDSLRQELRDYGALAGLVLVHEAA